jgi:hypothetical protein
MTGFAIAALCLGTSCALALAQTPAAPVGGQPRITQEESKDGASPVFSKITPTLQRKSRVLPRLPSYLPGIDRSSDLYAILESADSKGYNILLGFDPDCEGQNVCLYGSVLGSVSRIKLDRGAGVPIKLRRNIQGRFIDAECFAYCNEAYVKWSDGGFYYAIGIKAGRKGDLIRAANSAIIAGRQR